MGIYVLLTFAWTKTHEGWVKMSPCGGLTFTPSYYAENFDLMVDEMNFHLIACEKCNA